MSADGRTDMVDQKAFIAETVFDEISNIPVSYTHLFGEYLAAHGMTQARIAETEKYAHVTFFFNGGVEEPNVGEDRILVKSPKVATYDLQPEMSAPEVCEKLCAAIRSEKYDVIVINFANPDMVGPVSYTHLAPTSGKGFIEALEAKMAELGIGKIASISGRYYAMDRDNRWDRVQKAYDVLTKGEGETAESAVAAMEASYAKDVTDEFFVPTAITAVCYTHL